MTCGKCERLIREGLLENIADVLEVNVFRPEGYANVILKNPSNSGLAIGGGIKEEILNVIHALVNGKFKAEFAAGEIQITTNIWRPILAVSFVSFSIFKNIDSNSGNITHGKWHPL